MEVKMVKTSSIIFMAIGFVLGSLLPIVLAFILHKKLRFTWKSVLIGVFVYYSLSILIGELALSWYLYKNVWFIEFRMKHYFLALFLVTLSVGISEEIGRYVAFKFFLKNHLTWENGIGYGIGHGGVESISRGTGFLVGLIYAIVLNANPTGLTPSMINTLSESPIGMPPLKILISGTKIVMAFIGHIALSLIVLYSVKNRKVPFLFLAILLHTILDFIGNAFIVLSAMKDYWSIVLAFCWLVIWIAHVVWIFISKKYLESNSNPNESTIESL
jgi:uncharacterized membrane protein YhfC